MSTITKTCRCVIYTRVSTDEQDRGDFTSCDAQEQHCMNFIEGKRDQGWKYIQTYKDGGVSGRILNRPSFTQMLADVKRGLIGAVVVYKRDRLSRVSLHLQNIDAHLAANSVALYSVTDPIKGKSAGDRFARGMLDLAAQFEVDQVAERTRDKVRARAEKGLAPTGMPSYGYSYSIATKSLSVVPEEVDIVQRVYRDAAEGKTIPEIIKSLRSEGIMKRPFFAKVNISADDKPVRKHKPFNKDDLRRMLSNPLYRGVTRARNPKLLESDNIEGIPPYVEYPGKHQQIVADDVWHAAQKALVTNHSTRHAVRLSERDKHGYILKGLLACATCQCQMTTSFANKKRKDGGLYRFYKCTRTGKEGIACGCDVRAVPADGMEAAVLAYLNRTVTQPELIKNTLAIFASNRSSDLVAKESQLAQAKQEDDAISKRLKLYLEQAVTADSALGEFMREETSMLAAKRQEVREKIYELTNAVAHLRGIHPDADKVREALTDLAELMRYLSAEDQKKLLSHVCERIEVSRPVSVDYLKAVRSGKNPRMFRVQILLATSKLHDLEGAGFRFPGEKRPKSDFEMGFTVEFPLAMGRIPFRISDSDGVVDMEALTEATGEADKVTNVILKALEWREKKNADEGKSAAEIAKDLGVSPATLSLHLKLLKKLDVTIINALKNSRRPGVLAHFSLRALLRLAELDPLKQRDQYRQEAADAMLSTKKGGVVVNVLPTKQGE